jgi:hypothetical protein
MKAESIPKCCTKHDKNNSILDKNRVVYDVDLRQFFENVSFIDKVKKDQSAGFMFLQNKDLTNPYSVMKS